MVGILNQYSQVDVNRMKIIRQLCSDKILTFHRAFDIIPDKTKALLDLVEIGCDRLLTSGGASSALEGIEELRRCETVLSRAGIKVVAAAGINNENVNTIITSSGVRAVHASSAVLDVVKSKATPLVPQVHDVRMGSIGAESDTLQWKCVSVEKTKALCAVARNAWRGLETKHD